MHACRPQIGAHLTGKQRHKPYSRIFEFRPQYLAEFAHDFVLNPQETLAFDLKAVAQLLFTTHTFDV